MTQASWNQIRSLENEIPELNSGIVAFVAALDCLWENDIPLEVYRDYIEAFQYQEEHGPDQQRTRSIFQKVLQTITGSRNFKGIREIHVGSVRTATQILQTARRNKQMVIFYFAAGKVAGLQALSNGKWLMVGYMVPCLEELSSEEVYPYLFIAPHTARQENRINLFLIG